MRGQAISHMMMWTFLGAVAGAFFAAHLYTDRLARKYEMLYGYQNSDARLASRWFVVVALALACGIMFDFLMCRGTRNRGRTKRTQGVRSDFDLSDR
jgi:hypothetical protein